MNRGEGLPEDNGGLFAFVCIVVTIVALRVIVTILVSAFSRAPLLWLSKDQ
jgi:hypothetical protein